MYGAFIVLKYVYMKEWIKEFSIFFCQYSWMKSMKRKAVKINNIYCIDHRWSLSYFLPYCKALYIVSWTPPLIHFYLLNNFFFFCEHLPNTLDSIHFFSLTQVTSILWFIVIVLDWAQSLFVFLYNKPFRFKEIDKANLLISTVVQSLYHILHLSTVKFVSIWSYYILILK